MLISKFPLWICALLLGGGLTLFADDNVDQTAARAALLQQMNQTATPAAAVETPPPTSAAEMPAPGMPAAETPAPAPEMTVPGALETPVPITTEPSLPTVETPAPEILVAPTPEIEPAAPTPPAVEIPAPIPTAAAPVVEMPAAVVTPAPEPAPSGDAAQAARAALLQQMGRPETSSPAAMGNSSPMQNNTPGMSQPLAPNKEITPIAPVPIVAPALPISATKEQKLEALLQQYKADQLTPVQYHEQRAAILAQP